MKQYNLQNDLRLEPVIEIGQNIMYLTYQTCARRSKFAHQYHVEIKSGCGINWLEIKFEMTYLIDESPLIWNDIVTKM